MALPAPIAYWPFNEATGTTIVDASGNGHPATLVSGTWDTTALKKFGAAALKTFDGGRGALFTSINLGTTHSIAFWVNGWDGSNDGCPIGGAGINEVYLNNTGIFYTAVSGNFGSANHGGLTGSHHVVVTRSGTLLTFYKNGVSLGTATLGANNALAVTTISGRSDGTFPLVATIDDLRLYDVALDAAQVGELYALVPSEPPAASVRVTQAPVEVLSLPILPPARVSQAVVEVLGVTTTSASPARVSQAVVELLSQFLIVIVVPDVVGMTRATAITTLTDAGLAVGYATTGGGPIVLDQTPDAGTVVAPGSTVVLLFANVGARVTQLMVEILGPRAVEARTTQLALEVLLPRVTAARVTQLAVEVFLTVPPCVTGAFPVDTVPAGGSCPVGILP